MLILTLAGFGLRWYYLLTTHPFFDEYTSVLAARQILRHGWPVMPSGLFYEHGLLATYVMAPFTALFINLPVSQWQAAHWGLMLSRWPSVLVGAATIPLIYTLGRRGFICSAYNPRLAVAIGLLAAGLFAFSPEGMVWGGRARMYALATILVVLATYWAYRGTLYPAPAKYRWWALAALLATLLTQLGALTLIPPLVVGMVVVGWLSRRNVTQESRTAHRVSSLWFRQPGILGEGLALVAIVLLAIYIKRLGQPLGLAPLDESGSESLPTELLKTATYQTAFYATWSDTVKFLSRQFGVPHHLWLTMATIVGFLIGLVVWFRERVRGNELKIRQEKSNMRAVHPFPHFSLFLWLVFGLIILEMVTLLEPFRRNPRYIVMYLPLFYLIAADAVFNFRFIFRLFFHFMPHHSRFMAFVWRYISLPVAAILLLILFVAIGFNDLRLALLTPEPAYEEALAFVRSEWQPGDTFLTMNTPAAGLYLGHADGFTVQDDAAQFLLDSVATPVDRWLGVPWLGTATDFNAALNAGNRAWFVIDTIRQPIYFRGDWLAVVNSQMEQVWAKDNALVYRTRPHHIPLPTQPDTLINASLDDSLELVGFSLSHVPNSELQLVLFWRPFVPLSTDYTAFLHLRNQEGSTVAQRDRQPLDGAYSTSHWQPGETVIDPVTLTLPADLPAGKYSLYTGLYQLNTQQRLPVANDTSGENAILLGEIMVNEQ
ncbi:MAG: hypothetical protein JXM69_17715 [Anaerolineae bacterium]|nr:hypothetical protein [Anaerolineae bacterium]